MATKTDSKTPADEQETDSPSIGESVEEAEESVSNGMALYKQSEGIRSALGRATDLSDDDRAQGTNLTGLIVGIAIAAIVGVGVAIPIVNDVISQASLTGIVATVVGFIPVMLGLLIFVAAASPVMTRT